MLDNRHLLPIGTVAAEIDGIPRILVWGKNGKNSLRVLPVTAMQLKWKRYFSIPDIVTCDPESCTVEESQYGDIVMESMATNHELNTALANHKQMPQLETVIIAAPGSVSEKDRLITAGGSIPIIAIGSAIKTFEKPAYCVISDYTKYVKEPLQNIDLSETVGVLSTAVLPDVAKLPWKAVTWYTSLPRQLDGIPYCFSSEGVITDAVCFAVKQLGAKKIIFVGVEQPATVSNYFWEGMLLQAHCFFYAKHGVKIWNCTPATSVLTGVILGSLEEACQSQSQQQLLN
jgi:hypothetical protein